MQQFFSLDSGFSRFMNTLWNLICISVLLVVCSLPIFTAGAAITAAYYTTVKTVRHHVGHTFQEFFSSFRMNFKHATISWVIYLALLLLLVAECSYFFGNTQEGSVAFVYLIYLLIVMVVSNAMYFYPCLSRFFMNKVQLFKMAVVLMFRHIFTTILLLLLLVVTLIGVYLMPWGILIFPGVAVYITTFLMERVMRRYMPKPEAGSEEEEKWYYQ